MNKVRDKVFLRELRSLEKIIDSLKQTYNTLSYPLFDLAIPSSLLEDCTELMSKTRKIGEIGRAAAIFKVQKVIIFRDPAYKDESRLIKKILQYMETPQYLRKHAFKLDKDLRYVGILPPLRTQHHPLEKRFEDLPDICLRDCIVLESNKGVSLLEAGLDRVLCVRKRLKPNRRLTLLIVKKKEEFAVIDPRKYGIYWGYKVFVESDLKCMLRRYKAEGKGIIATSRYGIELRRIWEDVLNKMKSKRRILILFGSPKRGLYEIFSSYGLDLDKCSEYTINFIYRQGVRTVRTEEAIFIVLAILNFMKGYVIGY
ncbi:MAG: hypothetical protein DRJ32_00710 [Thermoprotei archaeon]|nr:MAG: hypothetical protein DRJ32_00710 [Thermoprotei archaeon]HDD63975.1 hypothetical protein [Thermoprotei archaeon]